jgi:hypothetical protein
MPPPPPPPVPPPLTTANSGGTQPPSPRHRRASDADQAATIPAHEFRVSPDRHGLVPPTAAGGVRYPLHSSASALLFDRPLRLPSAGAGARGDGSRASNGAAAPAAFSTEQDAPSPGKAKADRRKKKTPVSSWREEWNGLQSFWRNARESGARSARSRSCFDWLALFLPCTEWLRAYRWRHDFVWDVMAGIAVAAVLVPQSISYANLASLEPAYGLYAGFVPLIVYSLLGENGTGRGGPPAVPERSPPPARRLALPLKNSGAASSLATFWPPTKNIFARASAYARRPLLCCATTLLQEFTGKKN